MKSRTVSKVLSPILAICMLVSLVAVLAPPGSAKADAPPPTTLYGANSDFFGTYNKDTGAFSSITGLTDAAPGGATVGPDGGLYAYENSSDALLLVDPSDGSSTIGRSYTGFEYDITGLAYYPGTGLFYGVADDEHLYSFDLADSYADLGEIYSTNLLSILIDIGGLTFAGGDVLYGAGTAQTTGQAYIFGINFMATEGGPETGTPYAETAIGSLGELGNISALTFDASGGVFIGAASGSTSGPFLFDYDPIPGGDGYHHTRSLNVDYVPTSLAILAGAGGVTPPEAQGVVDPAVVNMTICQDIPFEIAKNITVPTLPGQDVAGIQVLMLQDETGSYSSYISNLQIKAQEIFDAIQLMVPGAEFGVAGFQDFYDGGAHDWGSEGDMPYELIQNFTDDRDTFVAGVNKLTATGGNDGPESQYEALYEAATGAGNGSYVAAGQNPTWSTDPDVIKVIILATDVSFHTPDTDTGYPGPNRDTVVTALNNAGIVVVGIEPSTISQLHDVATATGGVVVNVGMSGTGVADAIAEGVGAAAPQWALLQPVINNTSPLEVSFDPEELTVVVGGATVGMTETVYAPAATTDVGAYSYTVDFWVYETVDGEGNPTSDGVYVGTQTVNVGVVLAIDPPYIEDEIELGGSIQVEKTVFVPFPGTDFTVEAVVNDAGSLVVAFDPAFHAGITGGSFVTFQETIAVPEDADPGIYSFTVDFKANDNLIGTQEVDIYVPGASPPVVEAELYQEESKTVDKTLYMPTTLPTAVDGYTVVTQVIGEGPLDVTIDPAMYEYVESGAQLKFTETISVPWCTPEGEYDFTIVFLVGDTVVGSEECHITVKDFSWAMLLYLDGDNGNAPYAQGVLHQLMEAPFGGVPVIVLYDGPNSGDSQIYLKSASGFNPVDDKGAVIPLKNHEVNMGNPQTITKFVNWARSGFSHAEQHAFIMWDNGAGWRTSRFMKDMTSMGDDITMRELDAALAGATDNGDDPLEVIGFDASYMQMLEVDYQVAPYAQYAVGSEGGIYRPVSLPYQAILTQLAANPALAALTPVQLATMITNATSVLAAANELDWVNIAAIDLSQINDLAQATDAFANELINALDIYDKEIAKARTMVTSFGGPEIASIDLYDFAQLIANTETLSGTDLAAAAQAVMAAVIDSVGDRYYTGPARPGAHGIAIYYPDINGEEGLQWMIYEPAYDVDPPFSDDTSWNEYLKMAPRLVNKGILAMYIPDILILAHINEDPIIRLGAMGEYATCDPEFWTDFTVTKRVNIIVSPEGTIDIGMVAMLYTQADLDAAGILKTQLMGVSQWNGGKWSLEEFTMDLPTWLFDMASGSVFDILGDSMNDMMTGIMEQVTPVLGETPEVVTEISMNGDSMPIMGSDHYMPGYIGALIAVPWLDMTNIAPEIYGMLPNFPAVSSSEVTPLSMLATKKAEYLTPIQYPQNLYTGWNAISLPVIPLDSSIEAILSGHGGVVEGIMDKVEIVWGYDAATGEWHSYIPGSPEASDLFELKDGMAYWIKMKEDATLTVLGSNMLAGPNAPPEYDLVDGWNFIGYKGILPMAPQGDYFYEYDGYVGGYLEYDKVTYNRLQGYNRVYDTLYTPEFLYPNDGYWIYVAEAGSIPGLNDEVWVDAMKYEYYPMLEATAEWIGFWMIRDSELGLRMAWNALWYAGWVVIPGHMEYGEGLSLLNIVNN